MQKITDKYAKTDGTKPYALLVTKGASEPIVLYSEGHLELVDDNLCLGTKNWSTCISGIDFDGTEADNPEDCAIATVLAVSDPKIESDDVWTELVEKIMNKLEVCPDTWTPNGAFLIKSVDTKPFSKWELDELMKLCRAWLSGDFSCEPSRRLRKRCASRIRDLAERSEFSDW